jgi:hypothetical protein
LVTLEDRGKLVGLETTAHYGDGIASVERLICEHFATFDTVFGATLHDRMINFGRESRLAHVLSVAPSASPEARMAFLSLAEHDELPQTPQALLSLASERPRSPLLRDRCLAAFDRQHGRNDDAMINAQIALILRDHFPEDEIVLQHLVDRLDATQSCEASVALSIFAPGHEALSIADDLEKMVTPFGIWAGTMHIAAKRLDASAFCQLIEKMLLRRYRTQFDAQATINLAVEERLQTDPALEQAMTQRLCRQTHPSISGSFARYLAGAGRLSPDARDHIMTLLEHCREVLPVPVAGFDAITDQWRTLRATLLDAVSAGLDAG